MIAIRRPENPYPSQGIYYHYSNPNSQGALVTQTPRFPKEYDETTQKYACSYTDRIFRWLDNDERKKAKAILNGGICNPYAYKRIGRDKPLEVAKIALQLDTTPDYVRIVHYYNVASGFSCPTIETIYTEER